MKRGVREEGVIVGSVGSVAASGPAGESTEDSCRMQKVVDSLARSLGWGWGKKPGRRD